MRKQKKKSGSFSAGMSIGIILGGFVAASCMAAWPEADAGEIESLAVVEIETAAETQGAAARYAISDREAEILMRIAQAEAEDGAVKDKALVMQVVLNRVESGGFPGTIEGVVFEKGQFAPVSNGRYYDVEPDTDCAAAVEAVRRGDFSWCNALFFASTQDCWAGRHRDLAFKEWEHWFWY